MMKSMIASCILIVGMASCAGNNNDYAKVREALLALERKAIEREFANDTAFLSSVMDSTFIELAENGQIKRKHDVLRTMYAQEEESRQHQNAVDSFHLSDEVVHLYEGAAVVSFIMHTFRLNNDSLAERKTRFYDVWVKRGKDWKAVAWQATPVM